jgi:tetratricopeptide (TPR) repeat protein
MADPRAAAPATRSSAGYTLGEVSRLFDLPDSRLRYWSQTGFLRPSMRDGGRVLYDFRDLIALKVAKGLLDAGLPLQRVRRSLDNLRLKLPQARSLANLRIRCVDDRVVVVEDAGTFEAETGQMLMDFHVASLDAQIDRVLTLPWVDPGLSGIPAADLEADRTAYDWFLEGCDLELEWDGERADAPSYVQAKAAYERALALDPGLAAAWTNLGSLLAEVGDLDGARDHFEQALRCDPEQPEAHANLAELALRQGDHDVAIAGYRQVLRCSPDWIEAHYGLGRALLAVGGKAQAIAHFERYVRAVDALHPSERDPGADERCAGARATIARLRAELGEG